MPMNVLVGKANKSEMVYLRSTFNEKREGLPNRTIDGWITILTLFITEPT
jgi:hypothetical protein